MILRSIGLAAFMFAALPAAAQETTLVTHGYIGHPAGGCANGSPTCFIPDGGPYTPLAPGQYGVAIASSTPLTIPSTARTAVVCADGQALRYTTDGATTPTASKGIYLANGSCVAIVGAAAMSNFRAITVTSGGTLDAEYFQ